MMPRDDLERRDALDASASDGAAARRLPMVQPRVVYVLIAVIAVVWLATELTGGTADNRHMVSWGANYAPYVTQGELTNGLSAGASTSIFGLFGALFVYFYRQRHVIGSASRAQLQHLIIVLAINVVFGVVAGGIDNWGHAGGLLGGLVLGWFLCPRYVRADALSRRGVELATPFIADENSLARNWIVVLAFVLVVGAIAYAASVAFRPGMAA